MREIPEMFKEDKIAQAIKLAEETSDLCCDIALDAGALIDWTEQTEDSERLFNTLGYAIDELSGLVRDIGNLYCMTPYYVRSGVDEEEVKDYVDDCLDGLETGRENIGKIITHYTILRAGQPELRDPGSKICVFRPDRNTGRDSATSR